MPSYEDEDEDEEVGAFVGAFEPVAEGSTPLGLMSGEAGLVLVEPPGLG